MGSQKVGHVLVTKQQQEALHSGGLGGGHELAGRGEEVRARGGRAVGCGGLPGEPHSARGARATQ